MAYAGRQRGQPRREKGAYAAPHYADSFRLKIHAGGETRGGHPKSPRRAQIGPAFPPGEPQDGPEMASKWL
eukprot:4512402-Pyramimonas_sp.AAC.1